MTVDTNGDGVADTPITGFNYGIIPNDKDGSVWSGSLRRTAGLDRPLRPGHEQVRALSAAISPGWGPPRR